MSKHFSELREHNHVISAMYLGVEPAELSEIAVDREVFQVILWMLPPPAQDFLADSVWSGRFGLGSFGLAVSVWGHFGHDISVQKQLIAFVYLNYYTGRRNFMLAGVIPIPFRGVMTAVKSEL